MLGAGCYAELGPLALHWRAVTRKERGLSFDNFLAAIRQLPRGIWRYGQAGDLPGVGDTIDKDQLIELARANRNRQVIAFTHKPLNDDNLAAIRAAEALGFHINASANSVSEVDELLAHDISVVTVLPSSYGRRPKETLTEYRTRIGTFPTHTPKGVRVAICPATYTTTTCQMCGICASRRPKQVVVGFPAHGSRSRAVDARLNA